MKINEIIADIKAGGTRQEKCLTYIYQNNFTLVYGMLKKHVIGREEVMDAYAETVILFREHVKNGVFKGTAKYSTYLYSILNNKCIDIIRNKSTNKSRQREMEVGMDLLEEQVSENDNVIELLSLKVQRDRLDELMNTMAEKCREILMDWNDGYSMTEIAERNGLLNEHTARTKRYNCMQQLMELVKKEKIFQ